MYLRSRRLLICIILSVGSLAGILPLLQGLKTPVLWAGDRLESRTCRECGGDGRDEAMALEFPQLGDRCLACGGDGEVDVIVPGPLRPTRVSILVRDAAQIEEIAPGVPLDLPPSGRAAFRRPPGALEAATIRLEIPEKDPLDDTTNPHGKAVLLLPPGIYRVTIELEGFAPASGELEVPVLRHPIWLEEANIIREPESWDHAVGIHGLRIDAGLWRGRAGRSWMRVRPGGPLF